MKKNVCFFWEAYPGIQKLLNVMKLIAFLLLISAISVLATNSYSQTTILNLKMDNSTVKQVLQNIESQSEFYFMYSDKLVDVQREVSIDIKNKKINDVLDLLFADTDVSYKVKDRFILLTTPEVDGNDLSVFQQNKVSGKVTDATGVPIPGVTIIVKGATNGTITNSDGEYAITIMSENAILQFSFVGMRTQEVLVEGKSKIDVVMEQETIGLDEVVAVGYGSIKKSDLTGSVTTVKSEEISAYPSIGMVQSLQGRAAGVMIQSNNGEPGSSFKVRVRGATSINSSSDPLYVVDGFPGGAMPPSEDIESVEILKDASATAIYGSRGANGVLLITTKHGKVGQTNIEFNSSYSFQNVVKRLDLLESDNYIDFINEISPGTFGSNEQYANTNWQDEVFRNGSIQNYQLSLSGGNENVRYYVSGIMYDQKGVVIESKFKRYSITSNLDIQATKNFKAGVNLYAAESGSDGVLNQETSGGGGQTGVISAMLTIDPTTPVYNSDGSYGVSDITGQSFDNPVAIAKEIDNEQVATTIQANFYGEYQITKDLKFRSTLGMNSGATRQGRYLPSTLEGGNDVGGQVYIIGTRSKNVINEDYFTYNKEFNSIHNITLMAGYSYQSSHYESSRAMSEDFITDSFSFWNLSGGSTAKTPSSGLTESELASFYGRINYKLFDRYLLTFNARYDGSSKFAKNNKWAFFPSGAIAWNIAEEKFMDAIPQISQLKLRASYGVTGNQAINAYQSLARLATLSSTVIGDEVVNAIKQSTVANDNLSWESTAQTDIGINLGLFDQRINLVADYYYKKTTDLLFELELPEYSGYSTLLKNIGAIENKGLEFSLTTVNLDRKLKWTTDFNFSLPKNKILSLPDGEDIYLSQAPGHMVGISNTAILREGESVGQFYGYIYDGVYQEGDTFIPGSGFEQGAGGEKFRDLNDDGKLDSQDRTIIGDPNPDYLWGLNNTFEYKGFDFNFFLQASHGNDIFSFTLCELETMSGYYNKTTRALDRWTPTNTDTDVPKASGSRSQRSSSRFIYDGSFIKLKNISLGYKLPKDMISPLGISLARIYFSAQNLLTFTDYPGFDPEVNWRNYSNYTGNVNLGYDYGSYPSSKSFTIGVQVRF